MSKKHHGGPAPVPPGNQPHAGPPNAAGEPPVTEGGEDTGASFQEQDVQRRLGNFSGAGEHPRQQPGRANDGDTHSK